MEHVLPAQTLLPPRARLAFHAAAPAIAIMAANAVAMVFGWGANLPDFAGVAAAPPAWASSIVWLGVYAALGIARWEACRNCAVACDRSRWVTAVLAWSVAYAFLGGAFGPGWGLFHALSLCALAAMALARVAPASPRAALWLTGPVFWLGYTAVLSVLALNAS